jgi:tRNA1(Val) A37 N6-methylase TrmN6
VDPSAGLDAVEKKRENSNLARNGIAMNPLEDSRQIILCAGSFPVTGGRKKETD